MNRICIAAERPLVDGGTTGYLGQVVTILKGKTACYDCTPKPAPKGFPVCTIRSTPDKPIHCIVWAKHLFNLFFGNKDDENSVTEIDALMKAEDVVRKLFVDDINKLIGMEDLWKSRKPPTTLDLDGALKTALTDAAPARTSLEDRKVWEVQVQVQVLISRHRELAERAKDGALSWDKDDDAAMDFVLCASNLRSNAFAIEMQTSFRCKQMAGEPCERERVFAKCWALSIIFLLFFLGTSSFSLEIVVYLWREILKNRLYCAGNIIPAIATTNAIISGYMVLEAFKVLDKRCV